MKLYLIFLNVWIASVYYMIYCEPRSYNNALAGFWGIMAIFWIYDLKVNYTPFDRTHKHTALAVLLCMLPLAYPLFSIIRGMSFPMMTSPVMPCSVAVFTIGLLLAFSKRGNKSEKKEDFTCLLFVFLHIFAPNNYPLPKK